MKNIVTIGEIMMRLSPPDNNKILNTTSFNINYGGGEANVAVALAQYGIDASFITKLPENSIGDAVIKHLKGFGVKTDSIIRGGKRLGIYFLENGYSIRNSKVIYDRADSSITDAGISEYNWDEIYKNKDILHISGITLALSEKAFSLGKTAIIEAKKRNLKVSFDFNYRSKLWTLEEAGAKIKEIIAYVDIAFASHLDFIKILGHNEDLPAKGENLEKYYENLYSKIINNYNFEVIVTSIRDVKSASNNIYGGLIFKDKKIYRSKDYDISIIDRVGTGDAFTGGYLAAYSKDFDNQKAIEFAVASGAIKHTIAGDVIIATADEVEDFALQNSLIINR